jgi:hypothetical protein
MEYIYDKMELCSVLLRESFVYAFVLRFKTYNVILGLFYLRAYFTLFDLHIDFSLQNGTLPFCLPPPPPLPLFFYGPPTSFFNPPPLVFVPLLTFAIRLRPARPHSCGRLLLSRLWLAYLSTNVSANSPPLTFSRLCCCIHSSKTGLGESARQLAHFCF